MAFIDIDGVRLEYRAIVGDAGHPTLVFLHEGLGSLELWRDFPDELARRAGAPALVFSRRGYGRSDPLAGPRGVDFMNREALDVLPGLLDRLGIARPWLIGHSDGASIALIHAALSSRPVSGLALMAPHVIVEDVSVASIARVRERYRDGDLRQRLAKYHDHVDDAFLGWADAWLLPEFRAWTLVDLCRNIHCPVLVIQGENDEYGTSAQVELIAAAVRGPVETRLLTACGHSPHRDAEAAVLDEMGEFIARRAPHRSDHRPSASAEKRC